ncbi:MAG: bifunctional riboflavin kinase/FAD synthetase [Azospirillaceae bacterium]
MQIFRHIDDVTGAFRGSVIAIGNFDGVHRGHLMVLEEARAVAAAEHVPLGVLSFEPHPRRFFQPDAPPFRLTPFRRRAQLLEAAGIDFHVVLSFDEPFSRLSPEAFVDRHLVAGLEAAHAVVGYDFHFGHKRAGSPEVLAALGRAKGFGVTIVTKAGDETGHVFSSSRVRQLLRDGEMAAAAEILGRPWSIEGRVQHGDRRGRTLGFPTVNVALGEYQRPAFGIYAVEVVIEGWEKSLGGVASIGLRPMWRTEEPLLEVFLFDFDADIYDRHVEVRLIAFQRPEMTFDGTDDLVRQMNQDAAEARSILSNR